MDLMLRVLCVVGGGLVSFAVMAFSLQASFSGQLIEPPLCQINGNKPIDIEFGSVIVSQIDGGNYKKSVPWDLVCSNNPDKSMRVKISAASASFNSDLMATSQPDLAIQILQSGSSETKLAVNSWLPFNWPVLPEIKIVPVKNTNAKLSSGDFSAMAALIVEYQ